MEMEDQDPRSATLSGQRGVEGARPTQALPDRRIDVMCLNWSSGSPMMNITTKWVRTNKKNMTDWEYRLAGRIPLYGKRWWEKY